LRPLTTEVGVPDELLIDRHVAHVAAGGQAHRGTRDPTGGT
jgi:hypothetical protein